MFRYQKAYEHLLKRELRPNSDGEVMTHCVSHEDSKPSMALDLSDGLHFCHACGFKGNFIQLLAYFDHKLRSQGAEPAHVIQEAREMAGLEAIDNFMSHMSLDSDLRYNVEQIISTHDGIKVMVKVIKGFKTVYSDTPNISSAKSRATFANRCSEKSEVESSVVEHDLLVLESFCREKLNALKIDKSSVKKQMSEQERAEAEELLKQPDLIATIKEHVKKMGVVGEIYIALLIYIAATSRIQRNPISVVLKGSSSSGKSSVVNTVMKMMPVEEVKNYTYLTSKSMFHMDEGALKNKILIISEMAGAEASDYSVRILQSEARLKIGTVVKDEKTGRHKTIENEVQGPVACFVTTTKSLIHPENETRTFSVFMDESAVQTGKVHDQLKAPYRLDTQDSPEDQEAIVHKHQNAQRIIRFYNVKIPYVHLITLPATKVRSRRDMARLLGLIESVAILHQYQREIREIKGKEYLIADPKDYEIAYKVSYKILAESLFEVPPKSRLLLKLCEKLKPVFTRGDMQRVSGWSLDDVKKYVLPLVKDGYVGHVSGRKGQYYQYEVIKQYDGAHSDGIITPEELVRKLNLNGNKKKVGIMLKRIIKKAPNKNL